MKVDIRKVIVLCISLIALYIAFSKIDMGKILGALKEANVYYVIVASIGILVSVYILALRWKIILSYSKAIPLSQLTKGHLIGYFGNNIFPLRFGEFMRAYYISERNNIAFIEVLGTAVLERFIDLITISLLFLSLIIAGIIPFKEQEIRFGIIGGLIITVVISFYFYMKADKLSLIKQKFKSKINLFVKGLKNIKNTNTFLLITITTVFIWLSYGFRFFLILKAFGVKTSIPLIVLLIVATVIGLSLPAIPGSIGTYHMAVIIALHYVYGLDLHIAQSVTLILHLSSYVPSTILGLFVFISSGINIAQLRHTKNHF